MKPFFVWRDPHRIPFHERRAYRENAVALVSSHAERREEACLWFEAQGERGRQLLLRMLGSAPARACGAAVALYRMGDRRGLERVLRRHEEENWYGFEENDLHGWRLHWLEASWVAEELERTLHRAEVETDLVACLAALDYGLCALRGLLAFPNSTQREWWERGLCFGHGNLLGLASHPKRSIAESETRAVRRAARAGLIAHFTHESFEVFQRAFASEDFEVMSSALVGFMLLRERRALPLLERIALQTSHPFAEKARLAIGEIAGLDADSLALLRPSEADSDAFETLLRPASNDYDHDFLLRLPNDSD